MEHGGAVTASLGMVGGTKRGVRDEEEGGRVGLGLGFRLDQQPQKVSRRDNCIATGGQLLPPFYHPSSGMNLNGCGGGTAVFYNANGGGIYDSSSAVVGMNNTMRYPVFSPAQSLELKRQALIYKHFVSCAPIPPDLLFDPCRTLPPLYPTLGRGGVGGDGYFNLRLANNDPEPGRCRRTDGKKWRCSRDVAPDRKYCDRHLHRSRPRSRKPVEPRRQKKATITTTAAMDAPGPHATDTSTPVKTTATRKAPPTCGQGSAGSIQLPFLSMASEKEPRYLDWMRGGGGLEEQLKPNYSDQNDPCSSFLNLDESFQEADPPPPRSFIDAWSNEKPTSGNMSMSSSSPSNLTLSMSNTPEVESTHQIHMGLSWMNPECTTATPLGGPLAEVLQSGTATSSPRNSSDEGGEGVVVSRSYDAGLVVAGRSVAEDVCLAF